MSEWYCGLLCDPKYAETWTGESCTLNGKPAVVKGRLNAYGTVAALPDGESYEWSWAAIDRIMRQGGDFRS